MPRERTCQVCRYVRAAVVGESRLHVCAHPANGAMRETAPADHCQQFEPRPSSQTYALTAGLPVLRRNGETVNAE